MKDWTANLILLSKQDSFLKMSCQLLTSGIKCESILVTTPLKAWKLDILFSNAYEKNKVELEKIFANTTFS